MYWDDTCVTWEAYRRRETKGFHGQSSIVQEENEAAIFKLNTIYTSESKRVRALKANLPRDAGVTPCVTSRLASSAALWFCPALAQVLLRIVRPVFFDAPADSSPEVLAVTPEADASFALPEHGPCLISLDDASFTT